LSCTYATANFQFQNGIDFIGGLVETGGDEVWGKKGGNKLTPGTRVAGGQEERGGTIKNKHTRE